jgi:hypothetical protein
VTCILASRLVKPVKVWCDYMKETDPSIKLQEINRVETIWLVKGRKKDK